MSLARNPTEFITEGMNIAGERSCNAQYLFDTLLVANLN